MSESALAAHHTTHAILGAFYYVYNQLGYGFVESVYQHALGNTLERTGHSVAREAPLTVTFENRVVGVFRADLIVDQCVIVETKAVEQLARAHEAQLLNYLHASRLPVGLLLNFGPRATFRRLVGRAALDPGSRERRASDPPPYAAPRISG
jgi:GxxExxY protein